MNSVYQQCSNCILDTNDDPNIRYNEKGICNHCTGYYIKQQNELFNDEKKLSEIVEKIKKEGENKKYDCLLGVSGGVDSTYLAYQAKKLGLRPLVIHFDNGWNSELAVKNIENIVQKLGFDLYTYVVDWNEFKDLQLSYIKASVIDIEVPTDHGFLAMLILQANKHKIKHVLSGHNLTTEGILPKNMRWDKWDLINLKDIHKKYGGIKLKTFPRLGFIKRLYYRLINPIENIALLNYLNYDKKIAKEIIKKELDWKDYGGKHYESIFTRFYQGFILPVKFKIDKRKAHLSTLICSGQITRTEALEEMKKPIYDQQQLSEDTEFVLKKFNLSKEEFEKYMEAPIKKHSDYKTENDLWDSYFKLVKLIKPFVKPFKRR